MSGLDQIVSALIADAVVEKDAEIARLRSRVEELEWEVRSLTQEVSRAVEELQDIDRAKLCLESYTSSNARIILELTQTRTRLRHQLQLTLDWLRRLEWGPAGICSECMADKVDGHAPYCALDPFLNNGGPAK